MVNTILIIAISIVIISILSLILYFINKKTFKYSCDSKGNCIRNDNGNYTSSNCDNKCAVSPGPITKYSCNLSKCIADPQGVYTTLDCDNKCTSLQPLPNTIGYIVLESLPQATFVTGCDETKNKCENVNEKMNAWIDGVEYPITTKIHGTSSGGWEEKSYNMKFASKIIPYPGYFNKSKAFILYAPYYEFNKLQDPLVYYLSNSIGMPAPNFYPVHLWINKDGPPQSPQDWAKLASSKLDTQICNNTNPSKVVQGGDSPYRGLYWVLSKINEDILDLTDDDFLLEFDRGLCQSDFTSLVTNYKPFNVDVTANAKYTGLSRPIMEFPNADSKPDRLIVLGNILTKFAEALFNDKEDEPSENLLDMIDIDSWVNYFIISEVSSSVDGYMYSTYMNVRYDDANKKYKIYMGPAWDYNEALSSCLNYKACRDGGNAMFWRYAKQWWYFAPKKAKYGVPQYYARLLMSSKFRKVLIKRYTDLRLKELSLDKINSIIDNLSSLLTAGDNSSIINSTFKRWPKRFEYVIPNKKGNYMDNYKTNIDFLKSWICARLDWLDQNMIDSEPSLGPTGNNGSMFEFGKYLPERPEGGCLVDYNTPILGCDIQTEKGKTTIYGCDFQKGIGFFYAKYPCDAKTYQYTDK